MLGNVYLTYWLIIKDIEKDKDERKKTEMYRGRSVGVLSRGTLVFVVFVCDALMANGCIYQNRGALIPQYPLLRVLTEILLGRHIWLYQWLLMIRSGSSPSFFSTGEVYRYPPFSRVLVFFFFYGDCLSHSIGYSSLHRSHRSQVSETLVSGIRD